MSRYFLVFALLVTLFIPPVFADNESKQINNGSNDSISPSIVTDGASIYIPHTLEKLKERNWI